MMTEVEAAQAARDYRVICSEIESVPVADGIVDHVIADPPYDQRTQDNVRHGKQTETSISAATTLGFSPADSGRRARWASWIATATRRWAAVMSDHESSMQWAELLERAGLVYVRCALWIRSGDGEIIPGVRPKQSGAPQFTGDRPAVGHEVIVLAHKGRKMRWNGHGRTAIYTHPRVPNEDRAHQTQKPVALMSDIIRDFVRPGETIVDPFAGSGSTLVAARQNSVFAFGVEKDSRHADYARRRILGVKH